jgi:hypothetical protein
MGKTASVAEEGRHMGTGGKEGETEHVQGLRRVSHLRAPAQEARVQGLRGRVKNEKQNSEPRCRKCRGRRACQAIKDLSRVRGGRERGGGEEEEEEEEFDYS